jgi:hypothetical protein
MRSGLVCQRVVLSRGEEEIDECEVSSSALVPQMLSRQPVDRQRSARHDDRLNDQQEQRARPDPPERREQCEERICVDAEADDLLPRRCRDLEKMAMRRRPDGLNHVAEIESLLLE